MKTLLIPENLQLEDERVLLRSLQATDFENLLPFSIDEPSTWYFSLFTASGPDNLNQYIETAIEGRVQGHSFPFIVFDKKAGAYAGSTRFYDIQAANQTLQLGYTWYGAAFRGSGLNRHCKFLLLNYAFKELGMERVEFRADNDNVRSIAAMKAIGCKVDGILRSNMPKPPGHAGRRDSIVLSILKTEWETEVKDALWRQING